LPDGTFGRAGQNAPGPFPNPTAVALAFGGTGLLVAGYCEHPRGDDDICTISLVFNSGFRQGVRAMVPYGRGLVTAMSSGVIYRSDSPRRIVARRSYAGTQLVEHLLTQTGALLVAMADLPTLFGRAGRTRVLRSPNGEDLTGAQTVTGYSGTRRVVSIARHRVGVLLALSDGSIHYSARAFAQPGLVVRFTPKLGPKPTRLTRYRDGVITVFSESGGPTNVYYSRDGLNLGSVAGQTVRAYQGPDDVIDMTPYSFGVLTAFSNGQIYYSPDGMNLGGGGRTTLVHSGTARVVKLLEFSHSSCLGNRCVPVAAYSGRERLASMVVSPSGEVITAFRNGLVWASPNGENLGGGGSTVRIHPAVY
jgi:hypothetical protein